MSWSLFSATLKAICNALEPSALIHYSQYTSQWALNRVDTNNLKTISRLRRIEAKGEWKVSLVKPLFCVKSSFKLTEKNNQVFAHFIIPVDWLIFFYLLIPNFSFGFFCVPDRSSLWASRLVLLTTTQRYTYQCFILGTNSQQHPRTVSPDNETADILSDWTLPLVIIKEAVVYPFVFGQPPNLTSNLRNTKWRYKMSHLKHWPKYFKSIIR